MFGWFKNGFSMTDLPAMVKEVESEWDTHTQGLKNEFDAVKARLVALEGQVFGASAGVAVAQNANVSRETQSAPVADQVDNGGNHVG